MNIYHYTTRDAAAAIVRDGVIRPHPLAVFASFEGPVTGERPSILRPVAWFTTSAAPSWTVTVKMRLDSRGIHPGDIWRFVVDDEIVPLGIAEWAALNEYPATLFLWMLYSAALTGDCWEDWRLTSDVVSRSHWLAVESLHDGEWRKESSEHHLPAAPTWS